MAVNKTISEVVTGWISLNNTGETIPVGTSLKFQSQVVNTLKWKSSATQPEDDDYSGEEVTNLTKFEASKITPSDDDECWIRVAREDGDAWNLKVFVQEYTL